MTSSHPLHRPMFVLLVVFFILGCFLSVSIVFVFLWVIAAKAPSTTNRSSLNRSAAVVVLGDVGRSPRMCYHAQSLAEEGWRVAVVGYGGTPPPPALRRSSVKHHHLPRPVDAILNRLPRTGKLFTLFAAPIKVLTQSASLFWVLANNVKPPPEVIIVQTPPALPTLFIVRLVGLLLGSKVIIDWHNLGHTILSMRFSPNSIIVRVARILERWTGQSAFVHLCVTQSLRTHLKDKWRVDGLVRVLYDRPPDHFRRATVPETHRLFSVLAPKLQPSLNDWFPEYKAPKSTPLTQDESNLREDRPALVVSSTSWTADEDFGMLLKAASVYEKRARELNRKDDNTPIPTPSIGNRPATPILLDSPIVAFDEDNKIWPFGIPTSSGRDKSRRASMSSLLPEAKRLPKMLLIVTGKGELRDQYIEEIARLEKEEEWEWVRIRTAWLQIEEYPVMLGSADVGVSLHSSSSGMDLPMKVVDMLGCGTPVCALGFPCIGELVQHGHNGLVFYNAQELATQLESLLGKHPEPNWLSAKMSTMDSLFPSSTTSRMSLESPRISKVVPGELPSDSSRTSSPPLSPFIPRPPSPMPSITLLSSPSFASDGYGFPTSLAAQNGGGEAHPKTRTWSRNWKRVVRTLLDEADEIEEAEAKMAKWEANQPGKSWKSLWLNSRFARRRPVLRRADSPKSFESSPISSREGSIDEAFGGASGIPSQYKKGDDDSILPRGSPKRLRQRTARQSLWAAPSGNDLTPINTDLKAEGIPGIEISPAEAN